MRKILFLLLPAGALAACTQMQMSSDLIEARDTVAAVEPLSPYVPAEVAEARTRLAEAEMAYQSGQTDISARRAREAIVSAQLAEARAEAQQAAATTQALERRVTEARRPLTPTPYR